MVAYISQCAALITRYSGLRAHTHIFTSTNNKVASSRVVRFLRALRNCVSNDQDNYFPFAKLSGSPVQSASARVLSLFARKQPLTHSLTTYHGIACANLPFSFAKCAVWWNRFVRSTPVLIGTIFERNMNWKFRCLVPVLLVKNCKSSIYFHNNSKTFCRHSIILQVKL